MHTWYQFAITGVSSNNQAEQRKRKEMFRAVSWGTFLRTKSACVGMHVLPRSGKDSVHLVSREACRRFVTQKKDSGIFWNTFKPKLKTPAGNHHLFAKRMPSTLATRVPIAILLLIILNDEKFSPIPFAFEFMAGPSMLPTIYPVGECYICLKSWFLNEELQVGDVIVFRDIKGGLACKRIIGLEGEMVKKFGEYVDLYQNEADLGIRKIPMAFTWEKEITTVTKVHDGNSAKTTTMVKVPSGKVWVEGDNPLHSVDSRHYGPIDTSCIRGKVVYRLWPRQRNDSSACSIKSIRPHPLTEAEMYDGSYSTTKVPYSK